MTCYENKLSIGLQACNFSELTSDEEFWKGCQTCKNYDVLNRTIDNVPLSLGMLLSNPKN